MKITPKQILQMYEALSIISLPQSELSDNGKEIINSLLREIRAQQSDELMDTKE